MEEPIPSQFKISHMDPYDGTIDSLDQLESYKAFMKVQDTTDALLYLVFQPLFAKWPMYDTQDLSQGVFTPSNNWRGSS